jgi:hypothetical protein
VQRKMVPPLPIHEGRTEEFIARCVCKSYWAQLHFCAMHARNGGFGEEYHGELDQNWVIAAML